MTEKPSDLVLRLIRTNEKLATLKGQLDAEVLKEDPVLMHNGRVLLSGEDAREVLHVLKDMTESSLACVKVAFECLKGE
jgi:hypothetical protein